MIPFELDRLKSIGGSDISVLMGRNPFKTEYDLWQEKKGLSYKEPSVAMNKGKALEDVAAMLVLEQNPSWSYADVKGETLFRPIAYKYVHASPDRLILIPETKLVKLLEIKVKGSIYSKRWTEMPAYVSEQVLWNMGILKLCGYDLDNTALVAYMYDEQNITYYDVDYDEEYFIKQLNTAMVWWGKHIIDDVTPAAKTQSDIASQFPQDNGQDIDLDEYIYGILNRLNELNLHLKSFDDILKKKKEIEEEYDTLTDAIKEYMKDNRNLKFGDTNIATFYTVSKPKFDEKTFAKDNAELYSKYVAEKTTRALKINWKAYNDLQS